MAFDISMIGTRFCMYLRKSRGDDEYEQMTGVDALDAHRTALYDFAGRLGAVISEEYAEVASGESLSARPEMLRLLEDIENGRWDGVFVVAVDRLSRGSQRQQGIIGEAFVDSETFIITPQRVYDPLSESDMEIFDFNLFMSHREYDTIKRRLNAGREAACRRGEYIGKEPPFGYSKVVVNGRKTLEPNEHADTVRLIFRMYLEGVSMYRIAKNLTAMGLPTPKQSRLGANCWQPSVIGKMLSNPVYIGMIRWRHTKLTAAPEGSGRKYRSVTNDEYLLAEGLHEPIISREDFEAVQARLEENRNFRGGGAIERNYYSRLLRCTRCGRALHYGAIWGAPYMIHTHWSGCDVKSCSLETIDNLMISWLTSTVEDLELEVEEERKGDRVAEKAALGREIERSRRAVAELMDMLEKGAIDKEEFVRRRDVCVDRCAKAEAALGELEQMEESRNLRIVRIHEVIGALRDPDFDVRAKNILLRSVIRKIGYTNSQKGDPGDDLTLDIELL